MKVAGDGLAEVLANTEIKMPQVPVYHNFTAAPAADVNALKANLAAQVAGSVQWEGCVRAMVEAGADTMIEFGPGNVLTGLLRRTLPEVPYFNINSTETLDKFNA
jgi:[acyl-carrier-protein] S-malonyltransferase